MRDEFEDPRGAEYGRYTTTTERNGTVVVVEYHTAGEATPLYTLRMAREDYDAWRSQVTGAPAPANLLWVDAGIVMLLADPTVDDLILRIDRAARVGALHTAAELREQARSRIRQLLFGAAMGGPHAS